MTINPKSGAAESISSEAMKDGRIDLGLHGSFTRSPARISVGNAPYYLVLDKGDYQLLSAVRPHQGGTVAEASTGFGGPNHGWRYDYQGNCINAPEERLASFPVSVQGGHLSAHIPHQSSTAAGTPKKIKQLVDCTIQLHTRGCLEFRYGGFSLLTDPWLVGPAFLGSRIHYPPRPVDVSQLRSDAIWISHEHSDHFHEPTLKLFDRSIPIYVPDFPNRRMVDELRVMGFSAVHCMAFGEPYRVSDGLKLT
jgi:CMP-N-acetylneuraminate monooxygenase